MTKEQIEIWIKEAHGNAVERGFYECPECKGDGGFTRWNQSVFPPEPEESIGCDHCKCTGIDPNKNIGELLMLIVCEIAEAVEAHRSGRLGNWKAYKSILNKLDDKRNNTMSAEEKQIKENEAFHLCVKDSYTDEIADVFIRLFDLCGYLGVEITHISATQYSVCENIAEELLFVTRIISDTDCKSYLEITILEAISRMSIFCKHHKIEIEKHIEAKMAYNRTRPYKHGKDY